MSHPENPVLPGAGEGWKPNTCLDEQLAAGSRACVRYGVPPQNTSNQEFR